MSANGAFVAQPTRPDLKIIITDRDNTLVYYLGGGRNGNETGFPINLWQHRDIFTCITKEPNKYIWIMLSRGGGGIKTRQQPTLDNDHTLDIFRQKVLQDGFLRTENAKGGGNSGMDEKENYFTADNYRSEMRKIFRPVMDPVSGKTIITPNFSEQDTIVSNLHIGGANRDDILMHGTVVRDDEGKSSLVFGDQNYPIARYLDLPFANGVVYRVHLKELFENRLLHGDGNNKLFQTLEGMAVAGIAVLPNEKMKAIGVELIQAGKAETVAAKQAFLIDDEEDCVLLLRGAGFEAEIANNAAAEKAKRRHAIEHVTAILKDSSPEVSEDKGTFYVRLQDRRGHPVYSFQADDCVLIEQNEGRVKVNLKDFILKELAIKKDLSANYQMPTILEFIPKEFSINTYLEPWAQHCGFESLQELSMRALKLRAYEILNSHATEYVEINEENIRKERGAKTALLTTTLSTAFSFFGQEESSCDEALFKVAKKINSLSSVEDILSYIIMEEEAELAKKNPSIDFMAALSEIKIATLHVKINFTDALPDMVKILEYAVAQIAKLDDNGGSENQKAQWKELAKHAKENLNVLPQTAPSSSISDGFISPNSSSNSSSSNSPSSSSNSSTPDSPSNFNPQQIPATREEKFQYLKNFLVGQFNLQTEEGLRRNLMTAPSWSAIEPQLIDYYFDNNLDSDKASSNGRTDPQFWKEIFETIDKIYHLPQGHTAAAIMDVAQERQKAEQQNQSFSRNIR